MMTITMILIILPEACLQCGYLPGKVGLGGMPQSAQNVSGSEERESERGRGKRNTLYCLRSWLQEGREHGQMPDGVDAVVKPMVQ